MKLRLLLWPDCNRSCSGCCNKSWDLSALPICTDYTGYDEILLTGGEPMLYPDRLITAAQQIRQTSAAPLYVYTAKTDDIPAFRRVLKEVQGMCVTLHGPADLAPFTALYESLRMAPVFGHKSLRLNIFKSVGWRWEDRPFYGWHLKPDMEWITNCPLPADEVFMRVGP